jgi:protease-4
MSNSRIFLLIFSVLISIILFNVFIGIPQVGIITIDTPFMTENTKNDIISLLKYAGNDAHIRGVVINMDSPGGEVTKIEEIYLEVLKLKAKKPVVVSVGSNALSGGYYVSSAANFIYVKPSSDVGNIGVRSILPEAWKPEGELITTGPYKVSGTSRKNYAVQVEIAKQGFLMAVISQRGDRLKVDSERLSTAEIFLGSQGVRAGLVDAIGTSSDAVEKAASIAGIANYETVDVNKVMNISFSGRFEGLAQVNKTITPTNYYIYEEMVDQ